jgi:hypothetical protein
MRVNRAAFRNVPYLAFEALGDRVVNLMPLWDGREWHHWLPYQDGIVKMQMSGVIVGEYLATQAEAPTDLSIPLVNFAWQRASWPELCGLWRHLTDDIHNMAASVAKAEHFVAYRDAIGLGASAFLQTELEYLLVLARSVFDLVQELIARVWAKRISFLDPVAEAARKRCPLPAEFSKIVLRNKRELRTAEEIAMRFPLSPALAKAYASAGAHFSGMREVRDNIVHGGKAIDLIFMGERGPMISKTMGILEALGVSAVRDEENENLVSLWPLISHIVGGTLASCNSIVEALRHDVLFPPPLAPGYSVFLRGFHTPSLSRLNDMYPAR